MHAQPRTALSPARQGVGARGVAQAYGMQMQAAAQAGSKKKRLLI